MPIQKKADKKKADKKKADKKKAGKKKAGKKKAGKKKAVAAGMKQITLHCRGTSESALSSVGEIYSQFGDTVLVSDAISRKTRPTHFALVPSKYVYKFHVENGAGKFKIKVTQAGRAKPLVDIELDTKLGFEGRRVSFEVRT